MTTPTTTVAFLDLSRSTALTDVHGDVVAVHVVDRFVDGVQAAADGHGRLVKTLHDGVLLSFDDLGAAIRPADAASHHLHALGEMPYLTVGATTGPVVACTGDVFGATVNLAARLADLAPSGELRVDEPTARHAAANGSQVEPLDVLKVRGFHEAQSVFRLLLCPVTSRRTMRHHQVGDRWVPTGSEEGDGAEEPDRG